MGGAPSRNNPDTRPQNWAPRGSSPGEAMIHSKNNGSIRDSESFDKGTGIAHLGEEFLPFTPQQKRRSSSKRN